MSKKSLEPAGKLVTKKVPTVLESEKALKVMEKLATQEWETINVIYVLDEGNLAGVIPIKKLVAASAATEMKDLMKAPIGEVFEHDDQEKAALSAVANDLKSVPVKDKTGKFLGVITADRIIDVLHEEHLEDFLRSSGIHGKGAKILDLVNVGMWEVLKARLPWLVVGLLIGTTASFVVSRFEHVLNQNTSLAFFITMVTYLSDSVGTQSETIFIRSQALEKFNVFKYIMREFLIGGVIGALLGAIASIFAVLISGSIEIGIILGLSLFLSMGFSTVLACITPTILKALGKDPAVGSGPFTTAIQDTVSVVIYFSIAMTILSIFN